MTTNTVFDSTQPGGFGDIEDYGQDTNKAGSGKPDTAARTEPPAPRASLRKKPVMPAELEQVMSDVAPDQGKEVITGAMARIERRIQVLEKSLADLTEKREKSPRESPRAIASVEAGMTAVLARMDSSEKNNAAQFGNLRSALSLIEARVNAFAPSAIDPPQASEPEPAAGSLDLGNMMRLENLVAERIPEPAQSEQTPEPDGGDDYLTAARRAALAVARDDASPKAQDGRHGSQGSSRARFLMVACVAPVAILFTAFVVLSRNSVTAEPAPGEPLIVSESILPPIEPALQQQDPLAADPPGIIAASPANLAPSGTGFERSIATLNEAAEAGDVRAMRDIGLKYLAGEGVDTNEAEAARWLMRASYKGEAVAQYWLATLYARGRGVPQDSFQAIHWYEAAAKQGNRRAMHSLAVAASEGWGGEKDFAAAARWFTSAAELGLVDAEFNLAILYERGSGVKQSLTEAFKWYAVAAGEGDADAAKRLEVLISRLDPADIERAQADAAAFKPKPMSEIANLTGGPKQLPGG